MSFPNSDSFWLETVKCVKTFAKNSDKLLAPIEFQEKFSNTFDYSLSWRENLTNFQWIIIHKGLIDKIERNFLRQVTGGFSLVFANEVFVVFSSYQDLSKVDFSPVHVEAFWQEMKSLHEQSESQDSIYQNSQNIIDHIYKASQLGSNISSRNSSVYLGENIALTKTIYGHKIYVDTRDISLTPHLLIEGSWEPWISKLFLEVVQPGMHVVEVGANVGYYSLLAASIIGKTGHIDCFEANPKIYNLLKRTMDINGFCEISKCINKVVASQIGKVKFSIFREHMGSSFVLDRELFSERDDAEIEIIEVDSTTLDTELGENAQVDILKMDAEGSEPLIVKGAFNILKNNRDIKIFMEFSPKMFKNNSVAVEHIKVLRELGFQINVIQLDSQYNSITDSELFSPDAHYELFMFRS